jgi:hypothetical protein
LIRLEQLRFRSPRQGFWDKNSNLSNNSNKFKHDNTSTPKEAKPDKTRYHYFTFREHGNRREFSLGAFMTFNMMQDIIFVLTMAFKPKLGVSAGGMAHTRISL